MANTAKLLILCVLIAMVGACSEGTPTSPSPASSTTTNPTTSDLSAPAVSRIVGLSGSLAFGDVEIGSSVDRAVTIANTGNTALTVTGVSVSTPGASDFVVNWAGGAIAAGASQMVNVRFTPTAARSYNGAFVVTADQTSGTGSSAISALGIAPAHAPKTSVGTGTYAVNTDIVAGRYFATPAFTCNLKRLSALGSTPADVIMWEFIDGHVGQWIVDIAPTDAYFQTDAACGTWTKDAPERGIDTTITSGVWLVGAQITPGTYGASAVSGCYWERLRGFGSRGYDDIIANSFSAADSPQVVTIAATDVGFRTNAECGTWTPVSAPTASVSRTDAQSRATIQQNKEQARARR